MRNSQIQSGTVTEKPAERHPCLNQACEYWDLLGGPGSFFMAFKSASWSARSFFGQVQQQKMAGVRSDKICWVNYEVRARAGMCRPWPMMTQ